MNTDSGREPTAVDAIATDHFHAQVALSPIEATYLGMPSRQDELDDLSPAGLEAGSRLRRDTLERLAGVAAVDAVDEVTIAAMQERLGLAEELYESGEEARTLNNLASPLQMFRDVFDLMPTATEEDWRTIARRLTAVPDALGRWFESLEDSASKGQVAAQRQVEAGIRQCLDLTADDGYFAGVLGRARTADGALSEATEEALRAGVGKAADAYRNIGEMLRVRILPFAPTSDPVGRERYPCTRVVSSERRSTSRRRMPGARRNWPGSSPRWRQRRSGSGPGPP